MSNTLYQGISASGKALIVTSDALDAEGTCHRLIEQISFLAPPMTLDTPLSLGDIYIQLTLALLGILALAVYGMVAVDTAILVGVIVIAFSVYMIRKRIAENRINRELFFTGIDVDGIGPPGLRIHTYGWSETAKFWLALAEAILSKGAIDEETVSRLRKYKKDVEGGKFE